VSRLCELYRDICLTTAEKARGNLSRVAEECQLLGIFSIRQLNAHIYTYHIIYTMILLHILVCLTPSSGRTYTLCVPYSKGHTVAQLDEAMRYDLGVAGLIADGVIPSGRTISLDRLRSTGNISCGLRAAGV